MKLLILQFYETLRDDENQILEGTMTINLPEIGVNVLGIFAKKKGNAYNYRIPDKFSIDENTKKRKYYPVFSFAHPEKRIEFMQKLRIKAKEFMIKWIDRDLNTVIPLSVDAKESDLKKISQNLETSAKEKKSVKLLNQLPDVVNKKYVDLKPIKKRPSLRKSKI